MFGSCLDVDTIKGIIEQAQHKDIFMYTEFLKLYHNLPRDIATYDLGKVNSMPIRLKFHLYNNESMVNYPGDEWDEDPELAPADKYWIAPPRKCRGDVDHEVQDVGIFDDNYTTLLYREFFALQPISSNDSLTFGLQLGYIEYQLEAEWLPTPMVIFREFVPQTLAYGKLFFINLTTVQRYECLSEEYIDCPITSYFQDLTEISHEGIAIRKFSGVAAPKREPKASFVAYPVKTDYERVWADK